MNKELFDKKLIQHKKLISRMWQTKNKLMIIPVRKTAYELALAYADCKCEKCKTESKLQYHHLIQTPNKSYMDFWKYLTQRNFWANIIILCRKCHAEIENRTLSETKTISQKTINKVKKKYGLCEENGITK